MGNNVSILPLILTIVLWGFLHSLFASLGFKDVFRRLFGPFINRFYRLAYNLFSGLSFLAILAVAANTPDKHLYDVPFPWSGVMVILEVLAVLALVAGFLQTDVWDFIGLKQLEGSFDDGSMDNLLEVRRAKLVTGGLYGYVRHPLYSAGLVIIWLTPIMTVNLLVINIALTLYIIIGATFEERKLRREFGQTYLDYATITPMFIPFTKWNKLEE
jgi:methanethiol S-methyltransferase